jgi:hypothetical protein
MSRNSVLLALLGCGHAPISHPLENSAHGTPFERAELALFEHGDVSLYGFENDQVTKLATYHVADGDYGQLGWADREHLFASIERIVVMIDLHGVTPVVVPEDATLTAPKPKLDDVVEGGGIGNLVVAEGAAWWSRCAWGYPYDGFQCTTYVHAQLWPGRDRAVDTAPPIELPVWTDTIPAGYRIDNADKTFRCTQPNGTATTLSSDDDNDRAMFSHWVSADPPRLLLIYGQAGYSDLIPSRWTLHAGCAATPVARGVSTQLGRNGLWLATDESKRVSIWRRGKLIGELPGDTVAFR